MLIGIGIWMILKDRLLNNGGKSSRPDRCGGLFAFLANGGRLPQECFIKKVEEYIFNLHKIKQKSRSGVDNNGTPKN